jgi:hypothetical protein
MIKNYRNNNLQLHFIEDKQLISKNTSKKLIKASNTVSLEKKEKKTLFSNTVKACEINFFKKRVQIRELFNKKTRLPEKSLKKLNLAVIGKSETVENIKKLNICIKTPSENNLKIPKKKSIPIQSFDNLGLSLSSEQRSFIESSSRLKITRKIVPISNLKIDTSDTEDIETSLNFHSRYY